MSPPSLRSNKEGEETTQNPLGTQNGRVRPSSQLVQDFAKLRHLHLDVLVNTGVQTLAEIRRFDPRLGDAQNLASSPDVAALLVATAAGSCAPRQYRRVGGMLQFGCLGGSSL